ncbi:MAG TPA: tRNA pseudouridine(55) synthase TruB, partial [Pyrinomonadaceae bacterium]|nr:tRNA pseudouridine(55) synthase TruB [Pyrinomonadaceae bacterium]
IDKPAGMTSHDVVQRVRRLLGERRIGHTGTLDPFATGVLVLLIGRATRLAQFLSGADKEYEATIRLGFATDTGDREGNPISEKLKTQTTWSDDEIRNALQRLRGEILQMPPMYSAKKRAGQRLYKLARKGEQIERMPVPVTIHNLEPLIANAGLLKSNDDGTSDVQVRVVCSAGTYVRTLAEDFGKLLGVGAHLTELRRTRAGDFLLRDAATLEQLQQRTEEDSLRTILLPPDAALSSMPFLYLSAEDVQRVRHGMALPRPAEIWREGEKVRMKDEHDELIAIGVYDSGNRLLRPRVVLAQENFD